MSLTKSTEDDLPSGWLHVGATPGAYSQCPVCESLFADELFDAHFDICLAEAEDAHAGGQHGVAELDDAALAKQLAKEELSSRTQAEEENERHVDTFLILPHPYSLFQEFMRKERAQQEADARERQRTREAAQGAAYDCALCDRSFNFGHPDAHFLDACGHYVCRPCLAEHLRGNINEKRHQSLCPHAECGRDISPADYKAVLNQNEYQAYLDLTLLATVEESDLFVACPNPSCHQIIERVAPGEPASLTASGEVAAHKEHFRFRCRECQMEFCAACKVSPYHEGYTCVQHKAAQAHKKCRFCQSPLTPNVLAPKSAFPLVPRDLDFAEVRSCEALQDVCKSQECVERARNSCTRALPCGHWCGGVRGESKCLSCLKSACVAASGMRQDEDAYCNVCWTEGLGAAPSVQLACGHVFHEACIRRQLEGRWNSANISFGFLECPLCHGRIAHPALESTLAPIRQIYADVEAKALQRLKFLHLEGAKEIVDKTSPFYQKPAIYAMKRFCYYPCYKCKKPYFGGERSCNAEQRAEDYDPKELICATCSGLGGVGVRECPTHKTDFIAWKCKFCCNVAAWFCFGTTHFCDACHRNHTTVTKMPRNQLPKCTCKVSHPPNGEEYCIGCSLCQLEPREF